jgi:hypothetical protein
VSAVDLSSVYMAAHFVDPTHRRRSDDRFGVQSRLEHASDRWALDTSRVWSAHGPPLATAKQLGRVFEQAA